MPNYGSTTQPDEPSSSSSADPCAVPRLVPALFIAASTGQPERIGEVAPLDPSAAGPFIVGREDVGDPRRLHFHQLLAGESVDGGPLIGLNISREQLRVTVEDDALRVHNTGRCCVFADGVEVPRGAAVLLRPGAVLEVLGNCVLLVGRSPLSLPRLPARLQPRHPFGEPDVIGIVGESWRTHQLRGDICFAAGAGRHVFVHGPTGTGKELVARAIHDLSPRVCEPFVTANSASFTSELAALELFGNPKSYPNPGAPERLGYFGQARGGTLLLDEIGEVLPAVQAPLLRALDGAYNRVGDPASRPTKCVVILATNRDAQSIKHDVLHRLGVTVETPALADRREDIPLLVRALLFKKTGRHVQVDASLIAGLLRSPLPGNVRELDNILTLSLAASTGDVPLRWPSRLSIPPPEPLAATSKLAAGVGALVRAFRGPQDPGPVALRHALEDNRWSYEKTASALGISTHKLYRLRIKYGLHRPE